MDSISDREASINSLSNPDVAMASTGPTSTTVTDARSAYPLETFTCFPKLPLELRLKVWHNSMPGSRVLEIRFNKRKRRFVSYAKVPTVLQICRESRNEALGTYQVLKYVHKEYDSEQAVIHRAMFEADLSLRRTAGVDVSNEVFQPYVSPDLRMYIDYTKDVIYTPSDGCKVARQRNLALYENKQSMSTLLTDLALAHDGCQILHLAFDFQYTQCTSATEISCPGINAILGKLVSITVVHEDPGFNKWYYSDGKLVRAGTMDRFESLDQEDDSYQEYLQYYQDALFEELDSQYSGDADEIAARESKQQLSKIEFIAARAVRQETEMTRGARD